MHHEKGPQYSEERSLIQNQGIRRPTWAEIDIGALTHNFRTLQKLLKPRASSSPRLIPVVKANAYGHGASSVATALAAAGATAFAVALVEEGVELRRAGIHQEILVLEGAWPGQEEELLERELTAAVHSPGGLRRIGRAAADIRRSVGVHIKVDTGMGRLGFAWDQMGELSRVLRETASLKVTGVFSHLACAEEEEFSYSLEQIRRFRCALDTLLREGIDAGEVHFANSAGILYHPQLRTYSVRPGIALYGYPPAPSRCRDDFIPVLTLKTRVGYIHTIHSGESAGYNRRFVAERETRAATLPIGYADGFSSRLAGQGKVIIRGQWAPILGAISMDMIVVDITDLPEVREADEAVLLGSSGECRMDATDLADLLGTIPYEVLCGISSRVPRIYR